VEHIHTVDWLFNRMLVLFYSHPDSLRLWFCGSRIESDTHLNMSINMVAQALICFLCYLLHLTFIIHLHSVIMVTFACIVALVTYDLQFPPTIISGETICQNSFIRKITNQTPASLACPVGCIRLKGSYFQLVSRLCADETVVE
jgi:hypothetical protein